MTPIRRPALPIRAAVPFRTAVLGVVAGALLLAPGMASRAATSTTSFTVSGTFVASCEVSASALGFGGSVPSPVVAAIDSTATVTATCSGALPFTVELGAGTGGTLLDRRMTGPAGTLRYGMYVDAGRTQLWGDGSQGTTVATMTGTGVAQPIPVYGRILPGQAPSPGTYVDQVVVTVRF